MRILVIGGGGREHAIAWKLAADPRVARVEVCPGNAGTALDPRLDNVTLETDDAIVTHARSHADLVVVGPEAPLVRGLADLLRAAGVPVVGPGADGARLEASKAFCKEVLVAAGVPTASYARVASAPEVDAFVDRHRDTPLVVKADGLAAGKGVIVCDSAEEARAAAKRMLAERTFGSASDVVVLEERLFGIETSTIVLTDGTRFVAMPTSQDHKRLRDGDLGPNTGGMGAYTPAPFVTAGVAAQIDREVIEPTLLELRGRGIDYRGFLYAGVMLTASGPRVLEYNVRLGDPETQALMLGLGDGLLDALVSCAQGALSVARFEGCRAAAVVVMAERAYPDAPARGAVVAGLADAAAVPNVVVFHAGTRLRQGVVTVDGGRVLGVGAHGESPSAAIASAYAGVRAISWDGAQYRRDIGSAL